jgi:hypothetical protein
MNIDIDILSNKLLFKVCNVTHQICRKYHHHINILDSPKKRREQQYDLKFSGTQKCTERSFGRFI